MCSVGVKPTHQISAPTNDWDHDHRNGCWVKFADFDGPDILHKGYVYAEPYKGGPEPEIITQCKEKGIVVFPNPLWTASNCIGSVHSASKNSGSFWFLASSDEISDRFARSQK
jgi:hypothetical protein